MVIRPIRRAVIETDGEIEFHVDGEPGVVERRLEVDIQPRALQVRV
jgi:diacylglycerol kinase family enzyme